MDFKKAYNSFSLSFLDYMLRRFNFDDHLRAWMHAYVFLGSLSFLVNGCSTKEISIQKGLKQGDHLAPFLFLLVVEGLSSFKRKTILVSVFEGFKAGTNGLGRLTSSTLMTQCWWGCHMLRIC